MVAESIQAFEGDGTEGGGPRFGFLILVLRFFYSVNTVWILLSVRRVGRVLWSLCWSILLVNFRPSSRRKVSRWVSICPQRSISVLVV